MTSLVISDSWRCANVAVRGSTYCSVSTPPRWMSRIGIPTSSFSFSCIILIVMYCVFICIFVYYETIGRPYRVTYRVAKVFDAHIGLLGALAHLYACVGVAWSVLRSFFGNRFCNYCGQTCPGVSARGAAVNCRRARANYYVLDGPKERTCRGSTWSHFRAL